MRLLGQNISEAAAQRCLGHRQTDPEHLKHQIWRMEHARAGLDAMFDENKVDIVLLAPVYKCDSQCRIPDTDHSCRIG